MNLTSTQLIQFKELLEKVNNEEKRAIEFGRKLRKQLDELLEKKLIDDYNFDCELSCFSSDSETNKKFNTEEGNPIFESLYRILDEEDETINWKENYFTNGTPLDDLYFSYAMHCICWHSDLSFEDILAIDSIWIDIKVDYQFFTNNEQTI